MIPTATQIHHARIMVECGCTIEDVSVTLGMRLYDTIYVVAPSLKANPEEQKRVRRIVAASRLPPPDIPVIHRGRGDAETIILADVKTRIAA